MLQMTVRFDPLAASPVNACGVYAKPRHVTEEAVTLFYTRKRNFASKRQTNYKKSKGEM